MMAEGADAGAAWENPLIPNAKLRQIYLAMTRARLVANALPRSQRGVTLGLEACLVSTSVDLAPGDLVSDALAGPVVEFLRGAKLDAVLRRGESRGVRKRGSEADCGLAARLPGAPGIQERMWAAIGAAGALKVQAASARIRARAEGAAATQSGAVVVYVRAGETPKVLWREALIFVAEQQLPIVFVVLPAVQPSGNTAPARSEGGMNTLAVSCGVPGIAVDTDDAVAIYRVAQESIGRVRIGGGAVLMECVRFVVKGATGKSKRANDAISAIEDSLLQRRVVSKNWMELEAKSFRRRLAG
ncbi:MAG TPA: thiamine pyrophosphate-dependent enzyme [Acidobacteriaceae bacterium]